MYEDPAYLLRHIDEVGVRIDPRTWCELLRVPSMIEGEGVEDRGTRHHHDRDRDPWRAAVAGFVEANLPGPPRRLLDVGCGDGWLSLRLAAAGYDVTGIDPEAPEGPPFRRVGLEEFQSPVPFDAAVAIVSLHHIPDLRLALDNLESLLAPDGTLAVAEFAWDRIDDATARWCLDRLPARLDEESWLHRRCAELRERLHRGQPLETASALRGWAEEEGFHSSSEMLRELRARFQERACSGVPYLYPELDGVSEAEERAALEAGTIQPIGFTFVGGTRRTWQDERDEEE